MTKQIMIIGLGQFGMALAQTLSERGVEVMAVDISQEKVDAAAEFVTHAAAIDITDENWFKFIEKRNKDIENGLSNDYYLDEGLMQKLMSIWEQPTEEEIDIIKKNINI